MKADSLQTIIDSLQQVQKTLPTDSTNYLAWFLASTTLLAIIIAPFIQSRIAKKQIYASTVTANRQNWINTLRDTIAEFISISYKFSIENRIPENNKFWDELTSYISNLVTVQQKIQLLLNPEEDKSKQLNIVVEEILKHIRKDYPDFKDDDIERYMELIIKLRSISQEILSEEWKKIKKGK